MFWESVFNGFVVFGNWQVWAAMIVYVVIMIGVLVLTSSISGGQESGGRGAAGCLTWLVGGTAVQVVLMGVMIAFLLPLLLGGKETAPLSTIWELIWPITKASIVAFVAVTILTFIPLIGTIISQSSGIQLFLEGVIIFRVLSSNFIVEVMAKTNTKTDILPGLLEVIGYIVIAGALSWLFIIIISALSALLDRYGNGEIFMFYIAPVVSVAGGLLPLFMYTSYIYLSLKASVLL